MLLAQAICDYLDWLKATRNMSEHTLRAYGCDLEALGRQIGP